MGYGGDVQLVYSVYTLYFLCTAQDRGPRTCDRKIVMPFVLLIMYQRSDLNCKIEYIYDIPLIMSKHFLSVPQT